MTLADTQSLSGFPGFLKTWRKRRRLSQLDLSLESGMSQRHISFLETGRSQPSRFAIAQLVDALQMPPAERDAMLLSAGFATHSGDETWSEETRVAVDASISHILEGHSPFPAVAIDRIWNLKKANESALRFVAALEAEPEPNMLKSMFKPGPVRAAIGNWQEVVKALYRFLELEVARRPSDRDAEALLKDLYALPDVAEAVNQPAHERPAPVMTIHFRIDEQDLRLFSLIATVGMNTDAALDDIRVETLLPADDETRDWFLKLGS
ncbi:MAG: helix-turn-helix domain-containing protein [Roseibium sp.]|nr:helix-turn-helix domain-containing protein [Roseibium sp.]